MNGKIRRGHVGIGEFVGISFIESEAGMPLAVCNPHVIYP